jgi:hypothetical protein
MGNAKHGPIAGSPDPQDSRGRRDNRRSMVGTDLRPANPAHISLAPTILLRASLLRVQ